MGDGKKVWSSLLKVLRTSTYHSLVTVTAVPNSLMKIGLMMPLAEIAAHTVHLGECRGSVQATNPLHSPKCWWLARSPCTLLSARCGLQSRLEASSDQSSSKNLAQQWQSPRSDMWRSSKPSRVSSRPSSRRPWARSDSSKTEQVLTTQTSHEIGWKRTLEAEWSVSRLIWSGHPIAQT